MILGEAAVEKGDFEHALNLFNRVESSHAAWNEAQVELLQHFKILKIEEFKMITFCHNEFGNKNINVHTTMLYKKFRKF